MEFTCKVLCLVNYTVCPQDVFTRKDSMPKMTLYDLCKIFSSLIKQECSLTNVLEKHEEKRNGLKYIHGD